MLVAVNNSHRSVAGVGNTKSVEIGVVAISVTVGEPVDPRELYTFGRIVVLERLNVDDGFSAVFRSVESVVLAMSSADEFLRLRVLPLPSGCVVT